MPVTMRSMSCSTMRQSVPHQRLSTVASDRAAQASDSNTCMVQPLRWTRMMARSRTGWPTTTFSSFRSVPIPPMPKPTFPERTRCLMQCGPSPSVPFTSAAFGPTVKCACTKRTRRTTGDGRRSGDAIIRRTSAMQTRTSGPHPGPRVDAMDRLSGGPGACHRPEVAP